MAKPNRLYTDRDHEFRDGDVYAQTKYRLTLKWLEAFGAGQGSRILNIGCGAGHFNDIAVAAGYRIFAIEPDLSAFKLAVSSQSDLLEVRHGGIFDVDLPEDFDAVVLHDVLEHIEADSDALRVAKNVLKTGGVLVISVPALPSLFGFHDEQLGHFRRYTKQSLRPVVSQQFKINKLRYIGMFGIPLVWWYSRRRRTPYPIQTLGRRGFISYLMWIVCNTEAIFPPPLGTSLLCVAVKEST